MYNKNFLKVFAFTISCFFILGNTLEAEIWHTETVDSAGSVGGYTSLALDSSGNPHISYYDGYLNYDLKYAWYDGVWHTETVDSAGVVGEYTSLALDSSDNPHISYSDYIAYLNRDLKYAWYDGTWHIDTVDSAGDVGWYISLALDSSDNPRISYFDSTNDDLKYAWYDGVWYTETVDSAGSVGGYISLALDNSGNPHISYIDYTNEDLKYTKGSKCPNDDIDCDGTSDNDDNCPASPNPGQEDMDGDGRGDVCDNCPGTANPHQEDIDNDTVGDVCDQCPFDSENDGDGDGMCGDTDNCPTISNPEQEDNDSDGIGDKCDEDDDNDGIFDLNDNCKFTVNPDQEDADGDWIGDVCDGCPHLPALLPSADGYNNEVHFCEPTFFSGCQCDDWSYLQDGMLSVIEYCWLNCIRDCCECCTNSTGIIEFDISSMEGLFTRGQIEAKLHFTVKDWNLPMNECLSLYNLHDDNENGIIEAADIDTEEFIGEVCADLQPGDTITIDVTSTFEHDLFDPNQMSYSGFVLSKSTVAWQDYNSIAFYDNTDPIYGPKLKVSDNIIDGDCILTDDNCPYVYNPNQEDSYPPGGNGIGDACDCEGNFNCAADQDVDGSDAATFKSDFGRSVIVNPCIAGDTCNGDFNCDGDVDGTDASLFKSDFGRSAIQNPCPACEAGEWCQY